MRKLILIGGLLVSTGAAATAITPNDVELAIASMAANHADQGREELVYDPRLHVVARARAEDMAALRYFSHTDRDGYGPNFAVAQTGYDLPSSYTRELTNNYIESISAGNADANAAFAGWMNSSGHRRHILAESDFYAGQTRYGIGYANVPGSPYTRYYVFITAPPDGADPPAVEPYVEWKFAKLSTAQMVESGDAGDLDGDGLGLVAEFALDGDPEVPNEIPEPIVDRATGRIEWTLPLRADLGSVETCVEGTATLGGWSTSGVEVDGDTHTFLPEGGRGFVRVKVTPP